jgi:hypothetical protein
MRPERALLVALLATITFVAVTLLVAWLLEDVIFFSLFVGIPAGLVSAVIVVLGLVMSWSERGH